MDDIIKMVTERVGIPQDKARSAVELIVSQLKGKLPGPIGSQIESALSGGASGGMGGIGNLMGGDGTRGGSTERREPGRT